MLQGIVGAFGRQEHEKSCKKASPTPVTTKRKSKLRKVDDAIPKSTEVKTSSSTDPISKNVIETDLNIAHAPSPAVAKVLMVMFFYFWIKLL